MTEPSDMTSIVEILTQMNEQPAIRNRRSASIWKALFLFALVVIGIKDEIRNMTIAENLTFRNHSCSWLIP